MRLLFVTPRYGQDIVGGAEAEARQWALRLSARDHVVEVLTGCATDYVTWANVHPPETIDEEGVRVHRRRVIAGRTPRFFDLDGRMREGRMRSLLVEREWLRAQGPVFDGIEPWLQDHARRFDVVVFTTYLYHPTVAGLPIVRAMTSTALTPTAHDEPAFHSSIVVPPMVLADGLLYNSTEERALIARRLGGAPPGEVVGMGIDPSPPLDAATDVRALWNLGDDPYLIYVGRIDVGKGVDRLLRWFRTFRDRRRDRPLRLVLVGTEAMDVPESPDIVRAGFVDATTKAAALTGATALVQPSRVESFSIVTLEAWSAATAVICDAGSDVVTGHAVRSGGGIPVGGFAEFEAAVELLLDDPVAASRLGAAGKAYVERTYRWPAVLERLETALDGAHEAGLRRLSER